MGIIRWLDRHLEEVLLSIFLIILITLTSVNVVLRYIFNSGLTWSDEVCKYCLIFSGFISIGYWVRRNSGICVDALVQTFSEPLRKVLGIIVQFIVLAFFLAMFKSSFHVLEGIKRSGQVSGTLQISMVYVYTAPVIGFGLAVIRTIQVLYLTIFSKEKGGAGI